jgi:hypothetical protein
VRDIEQTFFMDLMDRINVYARPTGAAWRRGMHFAFNLGV